MLYKYVIPQQKKFLVAFVDKILDDLTEYIIDSSTKLPLQVTLYELCENTVKHSTDNHSTLTIEIITERNIISIKTCNKATQNDYEIVCDELTGLSIHDENHIQDEYLLRLIAASVYDHNEPSRLGLVRIALELRANIKSTYNDGILNIQCIAPLIQNKVYSIV